MKISLKYSLLVCIIYAGTVFSAPGDLDTTANGGTGFGNATPALATGYAVAGFSDNTNLNCSAIQPDGKIIVAGADLDLGDALIARYNINGTEDSSFGSGFQVYTNFGATSAAANAVTILANGNIVIVGKAVSGGLTKYLIAQFLPSGVLDTTGFGSGNGYVMQNVYSTTGDESIDIANAVAVDTAGNIYVVGTSDQVTNGAAKGVNLFVASYTSAGDLRTGAYNSGGAVGGGGAGATISGIALLSIGATGTNNLQGNGAAIDSSGRVVSVGSSSAGTDLLVARFSTDGSLDTAGFNASGTPGYILQSVGGTDVAYGVDFQSNGKIIIAGTDGTNAAVARFTTAGVLDTTFGILSSGYNVANTFGGSSAIAYGLAVQSNDTIVVGGQAIISATENFAIARYLADGSALDTSFSTDGYTTSNIDNPSYGRTLSIQSNGSFILAGKVSTGNTTFGTARYLGDAAPQGCMDITYNQAIGTSPGTPGFRTYPTDTTAANEPQVKALQAMSNNKVYVLTEDLATATKSQLVQLNSDGSTNLTAVNITQIGGIDVIVDSQQRALVVGTASGSGWLRRSTSSTSLTADTTFGSSGFVTESTNSSSFRRVGEQKAGRVIVIGQSNTSANGLLIAYNEAGVLATSSQTVCDPFGAGSTGFITLASSTFYDMIIDANDGIYVAYVGTSGNIKIAKYLANGSGLDTANFGTAGIVDTGLPITDNGIPSITFDNSGNIIVGVVATASGNLIFQRYAPTTGSSITAGSVIYQTASLLTTPVILNKLQCDTNNRLVFTGYDANYFFIGRSGSTVLTLDTTFAPYSSSPGILKTKYDDNNPSDGTTPTRVSNGVCIAPSGAILFGGYENITSSTTISVVGQIVGDTTPYGQVARYPGALYSGTINTLYGTNGAQDLNTTLSLPAGQAQAINVITAGAQVGKMLVADSNGTSTTIAMLNSAGTDLDANAFGTGVSSVVLTGVAQAQTIMVDSTGLVFYILGTDGKLRSLTYGSATVTTFATSTLTAAYGIAQQVSGRILVSGYDGARGVVVSYTPTGVIDTSFNEGGFSGAPAGYWYTDSANPITAISVGTIAAQKDRIYIAYADNGAGLGNAVVRQILENGTSYAPSSGTGAFTPITTGFSGTVNGNTQVRMQLDVNGAIVLVAATLASPSAIKAARYNANGTTGGSYGVPAITVIAATANQVIENILTLSDGSTLILAAVPNATPASASMNIAQLTSAFALDTINFNSLGSVPGVLTTNVPSSGSYTSVMSDFYSLDVITAGGIFIAGDNSPTAASAHPYLTQLVNADIVTKVSQSATSLGAAGALDTTFNPAGSTPGFMNLNTELQTTVFPTATTIYSLLQKTNGSYYVAGSSSTNSYVTLMSDDDVQDATFGLVTIAGSGKTNASSMLLAQDGNLLVAGAGLGTFGSGWIVSLNPTTGAVVSAFAPTATLYSHYAIAQQSTGRILVAGIFSGVGEIIAYNSVTGALDTTFGSNGYYVATGYGAINSMILDASDNIYFIANDISNNAKVIKLTPSGSGAASGWTVPTVTANSTLAINNHLAFNQAGNIVAVAVDTTTPRIVLKTITASSGSAGAAFNLAVGSTGITTPKVTAIMVDLNTSPGKVILAGFDDQATDIPFILRTNTGVTALDTTFNSSGANPGVQPYNTLTSGVTTNWYAGMINANGKITVAGYASALAKPYVMRVYGDQFKAEYLPTVTAGTQGTIDTNFGTSGQVLLASLSGGGPLAGLTARVVLPTTSWQYYIAFTSGALIRLTNGAALDTSFGGTGFGSNSSAGVLSMMIDGSNRLVLAGATGGAGWVNRYNAGLSTLDTTFNSAVATTLSSLECINVNEIKQQTLGRYIMVGRKTDTPEGAVFACTSTGAIDTTFNSSGTPGYYGTGVDSSVYALAIDQYDRIIIAYRNNDSTAVDVVRLTSAGQLDTSFNSTGTVTSAITAATSDAQVRVVIDYAGNIIVAAKTTPGISFRGLSTTGTNVYSQLDISTIITATPVLTDLIATADGKVLLSGYQSGNNSMWVARVTVAGALDTTFGGGDGIMTFTFNGSTATSRRVNAIDMYGDGQIAMVGIETVSGITYPYLSMAYDNPYTAQVSQGPDSQPIGTNDVTLGASSTTATNLGVTFFASSGADATSGQVARAIALQDDANIMVAVDGGSAGAATPSNIFLKMFNIDGVANTTFGTSGQQTVLTTYQNQYVQDMVTFTTVDGIHKAILAGYGYSSTLGQTGSLLLQYNLDTHALDSTFGGFNGEVQGVCFGDGKQLNVIGTQSNGRIIAGGLDQNNNGLLLGYTANGKLDTSFGNDGYQSTNTGTTGIYTHAIDTQNRVVIAYRDTTANNVFIARFLADGSGLDTSFSGDGLLDTSLVVGSSGNNNMRIAVDSSNNIAIVVVNAAGNVVTVNSYDSSGTTPTTYVLPISVTTFVISRLLIDANGKVVVVGYDTTGSDQVVIARTTTAKTALDTTTFNTSGAIPGCLKYAVASGVVQVATYAIIHPDGRIIVVGSES